MSSSLVCDEIGKRSFAACTSEFKGMLRLLDLRSILQGGALSLNIPPPQVEATTNTSEDKGLLRMARFYGNCSSSPAYGRTVLSKGALVMMS